MSWGVSPWVYPVWDSLGFLDLGDYFPIIILGKFSTIISSSIFSWSFFPVQFSSVTRSCTTLCDPMYRSMPGLPVHHQLLRFTQTHVHRVGDAIQQSHPQSSPSPPAPNPTQHRVFSNESTLRMRWPKYWIFRPLAYPYFSPSLR